MAWMSAIILAAFAQVAPSTEPARIDNAQAIDWRSDVREAQAAALQQDRLLVVFVTSEKCKFCTKMKQSTLVNPAVVGEIAAHCVAVKAGADAAAAVAARTRITAFPTTLLVSPDGRVLDRIKGYVSASEFKRRLISSRQKTIAAKAAVDKPSTEVAAAPKKSSRRTATKR